MFFKNCGFYLINLSWQYIIKKDTKKKWHFSRNENYYFVLKATGLKKETAISKMKATNPYWKSLISRKVKFSGLEKRVSKWKLLFPNWKLKFSFECYFFQNESHKSLLKATVLILKGKWYRRALNLVTNSSQ